MYICRYTTPADASAHFSNLKLPSQSYAAVPSFSLKSSDVQTDPVTSSTFLDILYRMPRESQLPLLSEVFSGYMLTIFKLSVPNDFLHLLQVPCFNYPTMDEQMFCIILQREWAL